MKPKVLAFYLPQYHPCKENDEWWGKGFTEWTNVGKAKPLFKGHDQPRVPTDLGYYDLRLKEVRQQQVDLARNAGVYAFCYWHYWFGNGKRLLADVFDEVLDSGTPDFPFCLAWANHSWFAKNWNKDTKDKLLIEQIYPGENDARMHFDFLLKAFHDKRYVLVDGCPFLLIFNADDLPKQYIQWFRKWTKEAGFKDLYLVANTYDVTKSLEYYKSIGYDAVTYGRMVSLWDREYSAKNAVQKIFSRILRVIKQTITGRPRGARDYSVDYHKFLAQDDAKEDVIPEIVPQWDHSPRSGDKASTIFYNSEPKFFYKHVKEALEMIKNKPEAKQLIILKSWNEWGEGNYMEPDITHGCGFIDALHNALTDVE